MKIVKVTYTVQKAYVEQNQLNIKKVMDVLKSEGSDGIRYSAYQVDGSSSFIHVAHFKSESDNQRLNAIPEFQDFQRQLKESKPVTPPSVESWNLVGSSLDIF